MSALARSVAPAKAATVAHPPLRTPKPLPARLVSPLQRKPVIGAVDDPLEREADRVADAVVAGQLAVPISGAPPNLPQRKCAACEAAEEHGKEPCGDCAGGTIRRASEDGGDDDDDENILLKAEAGASHESGAGAAARAVAAGGTPMSAGLRSYFEPRFGRGFADVRLHTNGAASNASGAIHARAYTLGHDIAFAAGAYAPESLEGRRLIAHELAHVAQQDGGGELVQRQEEEDLPRPPGRGPGRAPALPEPDVVIEPPVNEPRCPRVPTNLGNRAPATPCKEEGEDIDGQMFFFCPDSDVFRDPGAANSLRAGVQQESSGSTFRLRAFSSTEGPGGAANADAYNRNLSCHRLNRMIRELLNAGVQENQIDAVSMGPTDQFGAGAADRPMNRVALIEIVPAEHAARTTGQGLTMADVAAAAKARLVDGDYQLGADAYFARWTCGRYRTLAEAVSRTNVTIGTASSAGAQLGTTSATGANTIVLSPGIAGATDPISCATNRIADLTFHHFSRPQLMNFEDQHRAGMHLVHLAGIPACSIPRDPLGAQIDTISRPVPVDPFTGFRPTCADRPLPGPMASQTGPSRMETPPTFTASAPAISSASGSVVPSGSNPVTVGAEPDAAFRLDGEVTAAGDPATIGSYELGFVQTVMAEGWQNTHVDGRRERRRFPLPLRDGPGRADSRSAPPWFDVSSKVTAAPGVNRVSMEDAPNLRAFRTLPDIAASRFVDVRPFPRPGGGQPVQLERPGFAPAVNSAAERNNPPDRGIRVLEFNTWLVARQASPPAPDTLGGTNFITGLRMRYRMNVDWASTASGSISGSGSYTLTTRAAAPSDAESMRLRGATPLDFVAPSGVPLFAEFLQIDPPLARAQAGGLALSPYADAVRQIVAPHRTSPRLRGEFMVVIRHEAETGRVMLDTPDLAGGAVRIQPANGGPISTAEADALARTIFPELRKLVIRQGFTPTEPATGRMNIPIRIMAIAGTP